MGFPYTYSDKIIFLQNSVTPKHLQNILIKELTQKKRFTVSNSVQENIFLLKSPFLKIPFSLELNTDIFNINYKIHLDQLIKIILGIVIFSALFSYTSLSFFFWFASLFSIFFYILNIMIMNSYIHSVITKILEKNKFSPNEKESLSEEQEKWLNDNHRCPACGHYLSDIDLICSECGLHLKRSRHTIPLDTSKYQNKPIKYHYKKE